MSTQPLTPQEQTYEPRAALIATLDDFTQAYLECALWSSTEELEDGNGGPPLDENHDLVSFDLKSLQSAIDDCKAFQEVNARDLKRAYDGRVGRGTARRAEGHAYDASNAGHDFWLTRNGHGAGFWDRDLGALGDRLSKASKVYGGVDLMAWEGVVSGS